MQDLTTDFPIGSIVIDLIDGLEKIVVGHQCSRVDCQHDTCNLELWPIGEGKLILKHENLESCALVCRWPSDIVWPPNPQQVASILPKELPKSGEVTPSESRIEELAP